MNNVENLIEILRELKNNGCCGVKLSFEDEGALLNEMITMRHITSLLNLDLSVKIGGAEAKRDIVDCNILCVDNIVAPMVESQYALKKLIESIEHYNVQSKIGFNMETGTAYNNLNEMSNLFEKLDFITFGRSDFVQSLNMEKNSVDDEYIYNKVKSTFEICKKYNLKCYMGGNINQKSEQFIKKLIANKLLDKFETRYIIFDINKININNFNEILKKAIYFELEWMKYIKNIYEGYSSKNNDRINMIQSRINNNL